jgi:hypothetical protein
MAIIRLVNPHQQKFLTPAEVQRRQARAVQFVRNVVGDPVLADEIQGLSVEDYAARKGFQLTNPRHGREVNNDMATQTRTSQDMSLGAKLDRLTEAIEQLRGNPTERRANPGAEQPEDLGAKLDKLAEAIQGLRRSRVSNPNQNLNGMSSTRAERRVKKLRSERDDILDSLQEVQDFLDEDQLDDAQDVLDEILDRFEVAEED